MTLQQITTEIRAAMKAASESTLRVADLVLRAKEEHFVGRNPDWFTWCKSEFKFARRHCFRLARIADYVRRCKPFVNNSAVYGTAYSMALDYIEAMSAIPPDRLADFLSKVDIDELEREEFRAAVSKFLGIEKRPHLQADFFGTLGLPAPERFDADLRAALEEKRVPPRAALEYGTLLLVAAIDQVDEMTHEETRYLETVLETLRARASKHGLN